MTECNEIIVYNYNIIYALAAFFIGVGAGNQMVITKIIREMLK